MKVDREVDFHGYTAREMRWELDRLRRADSWRGWRRLRVIHGTGEVLRAELRVWCDERGVSWSPEPHNPGSTILHPFRSPKPLAPPPPPPRLAIPRPVTKRSKESPSPPEPPAKPEESRAARDLMKQEFERLAEQPPDVIKRRKRGHDVR